MAVAEQVDEVARVLLAGDEQHLAHADPLQQLQRVVDHRPAADRQQVLVRDARQLLEPRRRPACADEALHARADATPETRRSRRRPRRPSAATQRDPGDRGPHRGVAERVPHLQPDERRQRPGRLRRAAEDAHVRAADVGRRERGDDRLRGRHPQHLADHEHDHQQRDDARRCRRPEQDENGKPISGIAIASFTGGETRATARVSRSWPNVTGPGVDDHEESPHRPARSRARSTSEIGSSESNAT